MKQLFIEILTKNEQQVLLDYYSIESIHLKQTKSSIENHKHDDNGIDTEITTKSGMSFVVNQDLINSGVFISMIKAFKQRTEDISVFNLEQKKFK